MYDLERSIDKAQNCIDDEFKSSCRSTKALNKFFSSSDAKPSKDVMFQAACSAMLDDDVAERATMKSMK